MEALLGALAVIAYVVAVFVLAGAAVYFIARDVETLDEDARRERSRMDLL
jgi:NADH:ubiquinone oxidoreductase subunit 6 (subunit J)